MLHRWCGHLEEWEGHPDIVTKLKPSYNPAAKVWKKVKEERCTGTPYTKVGGDKLGPETTEKKCLHTCFANQWTGNAKVPVKKCVALTFYPKPAKEGEKQGPDPVGYCDLYDKCDKTTSKEAGKGVVTFKKIPRVEGKPKEEKPEQQDEDDEED